jgi:hypothetical protein
MPPRASYLGVLALTLAAALITACLSSAGLAAWTDALPDSAAARLASSAAHSLDDAMTRLGVNRPGMAVQETLRAIEAKKF